MSSAVEQLTRSVEEEPMVARPRRRTIATHQKYPAARSTVGDLAEAGLPVDERAIIARDIRPADPGPPREIALAMIDGALIGAFVGLLLGSFAVVQPVMSAIVVGFWSLGFGAAVGAAITLLRTWVSPAHPKNGRALVARSFDVVVDVGIADRARSVLRERKAVPIGPVSRPAPLRTHAHERRH